MISKKQFPLLLIILSTTLFAQNTSPNYKLYGFIRNDFYLNTRQNVEAIDGLFLMFPKPEEKVGGKDKNDVAQAEMLSVGSRIGVDITGADMLGAKTSAKFETDFAGFGTNNYVLRIRQAYTKFNWEKSELLVGQTWHPMFGSVIPVTMSLNTGSPFQPFNRSPQIRFKQNLGKTASLMLAATYQLQYVSQGYLSTTTSVSIDADGKLKETKTINTGGSNTFMKNSLIPNLFVGTEFKTKQWLSGLGVDFKAINPSTNVLNPSFSAVAYSQYVNPVFQIKAKAVWGQNLSDHLMIGGYGVSKYESDNKTVASYTNFNTVSSWINAVYGKKMQVGIFLGISENLGTDEALALSTANKFTAYGYGFYDGSQQILDRLYRVMPHVSYNLPNLKFGLEYDYTAGEYGNVNSNGRVSSTYTVRNHRAVASICYFF